MNVIKENLSTIIRAVYVVIVTTNLFRVSSYSESFNFVEVAYEMGITFACYVLTGRKYQLTWNLIASSGLFYLCIPFFALRFRFVSLIYLIKYFHLNVVLRDLENTLRGMSWLPHIKILTFGFNFIRYTILEYLFLGFMITGYKLYTLGDKQTLPQDYQLWYQMLVTCSTIGYGDVTPKSKNQMVYFTLIIPLVCCSFAIYLNQLYDKYNLTFIDDNEQETPEFFFDQPIDILRQYLAKFKVSPNQIQNLTSYVEKVKSRNQSRSQFSNALKSTGVADDQNIKIGLNLKKCRKFIDKLSEDIASGNEALRRCLAANLKETCFPKGAYLLDVGQTSSKVMYIAEGTVQKEGEKIFHLKEKIFNQDGFYFGEACKKLFIAETFCVIWSIDSKEIKQNFASLFEPK